MGSFAQPCVSVLANIVCSPLVSAPIMLYDENSQPVLYSCSLTYAFSVYHAYILLLCIYFLYDVYFIQKTQFTLFF